jgi:hypothetical protein
MTAVNLFKRALAPLLLLLIVAAVWFWPFSSVGWSAAVTSFQPTESRWPDYDIRTAEDSDSSARLKTLMRDLKGSLEALAHTETGQKNAEEALRTRIPDLKIEYNDTLRVPEVISPSFGLANGILAAGGSEKRVNVLRNFIRQNSGLFCASAAQIDDLNVVADYTNPDGNLSYVYLEQVINGIPVFNGEVKAGFTKKNELFRIVNNLAPGLDYQALSTDFGDAQTAIINARKHFGEAENPVSRLDDASAEKIYFPLAHGAARAAWKTLLWKDSEMYYTIVDSQTGSLLWRKSLTSRQTQPATYNVYGSQTSLLKTAESAAPRSPLCFDPACPAPAAIVRQSFTLIGNESPYAFNNLGWLNDGETRTIGNNAEAGINRDGLAGIDPDGWAFGGPTRNFVYTYNPAPGLPPPGAEPLPTTQTYPPTNFQQGIVTNAFYYVNRWHDELYLLGFNEQARNFQRDNFGRGGLGNDHIVIEAQTNTGTGSISCPSDGQPCRLILGVWTGSVPNRDVSLDATVALHELTHGLSTRLHGNGIGLGGQGAMMGEGWSDFYPLALMSDPAESLHRTYTIGTYAFGSVTTNYHGLRRFPMAIKSSLGGPNNLPHNPLSFRHLNAGCDTQLGNTTTAVISAFPRGPVGTVGNCAQVHNAGEIWLAALWESRGQLILKHGGTTGNRRILQYTTDGMKLAPLNPTMLQERDAIFAAVQATNPADLCAVARGFAVRGIGLSASVQSSTAVTEAFDIPASCQGPKRADFDGDGRSDVSVYRPGEGVWYLNRSMAGFAALRWGIATDKIAPGDYDGDGKADVAVFRADDNPANADFYILNSSNLTLTGVSWGVQNDIPVVEDYDGDGKADPGIFRPTEQRFYVLQSSNAAALLSRPLPGAKPITGDFDGDRRGDFAVFGGGQWFVSKSSDNYNSGFVEFWGLDTDKLVPGDYDGDFLDDVAVYRPSEGFWYIKKSSGGNTITQFGAPADIPVPADYDGDGRADIAIYRNGAWWINRSTAGLTVVQFGLGGDAPAPAA